MTDNERLIKLRQLRNNLITLGISDEVNNLENIFPELKMDSIDEDENTKNELFKHLKEGAEGYEPAGSSEDYAKWLGWFEKQFKQTHYTSDAPIGQKVTGEVVYVEDVNPIKPKFERGCLITNDRYIKHIVGIGTKGDMPYYYMFEDGTTKYIDEIDKKWHLWTINDAKDGDIIAFNIDEDLNHKWIGIFKERPNEDLYDNKYCTCKFYCLINFINEEPEFEIGGVWNVDITDVQPATKKECDIIYNKIKEESLMWDDVNKVLIVVKQTNAKFNVGDTIQYNGLGHNEYVIKEVHYPTHYVNELGERMDMSYTDANFTFIDLTDNFEDNRHNGSEEDKKLTNVNHEYFSELLENNNSNNINDYAYQVAYCMSHDWTEETATWDDVQKACKLGAEWNKKHHKSAWNENDERMLHTIIADFKGFIRNNTSTLESHFNECIGWLKSIKDRVQPKQEWNEEGERTIKEIDEIIYECPYCESKEEISNWLNSLKDNIKFNYSKDDKMLDKIMQIVSNYWNSIPDSNIDENEEVESCYNWLKSIK